MMIETHFIYLMHVPSFNTALDAVSVDTGTVNMSSHGTGRFDTAAMEPVVFLSVCLLFGLWRITRFNPLLVNKCIHFQRQSSWQITMQVREMAKKERRKERQAITTSGEEMEAIRGRGLLFQLIKTSGW